MSEDAGARILRMFSSQIHPLKTPRPPRVVANNELVLPFRRNCRCLQGLRRRSLSNSVVCSLSGMGRFVPAFLLYFWRKDRGLCLDTQHAHGLGCNNITSSFTELKLGSRGLEHWREREINSRTLLVFTNIRNVDSKCLRGLEIRPHTNNHYNKKQ